MAPPAIPAEIRQAHDPARKAKLMRMHKVASARIRASILRNRRQRLKLTLARARQTAESEQRILRLEAELKALDEAVGNAEQALQQAEAAVDR
jgi:hypothetical protein